MPFIMTASVPTEPACQRRFQCVTTSSRLKIFKLQPLLPEPSIILKS